MINVNLNQFCTHCNNCEKACVKQAIYFENKIPHIDSNKCNTCGLCIKVCPTFSVTMNVNFPAKYFILKNRNTEELLSSSSGAVFIELAKEIIKRGGYVFGCVFDENINPVIIGTNDLKVVQKMKGSKYVEADHLDSFEKVRSLLEKGIPVLYTGTPCKIRALKLFLKKDYKHLICCEIICHGVIDNSIFNNYISYLETRYKCKIVKFNFRAKRDKLDSLFIRMTIEKKGKTLTKYIAYEESSYYYFFISGYLYNESCYNCNFSQKTRFSDLTIGDYWGGDSESFLPKGLKKGSSSLIVSTEKGYEIFDCIKKEFALYETTFDIISKNNLNLIKSSRKKADNEKVYKVYKEKGFFGLTKFLKREHFFIFVKGFIKSHAPIFVLKLFKENK